MVHNTQILLRVKQKTIHLQYGMFTYLPLTWYSRYYTNKSYTRITATNRNVYVLVPRMSSVDQ